MKKNLTFLFSFTQFAYWSSFAVIAAYSSLYLLSIGVSNSRIGIVMAVGSMLSALFQPVLGTISDRYPSFSARKILFCLIVLILLGASGLIVNGSNNQLLGCILFGFLVMLLQITQPFVNSIAMLSINDGYKLNFSISRGIGSVGYAASAYLIGNLAARTGAVIVPICCIATVLLLGITLVFFPSHKIDSTSNIPLDKQTKPASGRFFFAKYPTYGILFIGLIMIYFGHVFINNFVLQIIQNIGGTSAEMGLVTSSAAMIELVTMLLFTRILKITSLRNLIRISGVFFAIKVIGTMLSPNVGSLFAVQLFQLFGWGIMCVGLVYYVNDIMEAEDVTKGQAYATMSYTLGSIIASWAGGILIDQMGVRMMLMVGSVVSVIGAAVIFVGTREKKHL